MGFRERRAAIAENAKWAKREQREGTLFMLGMKVQVRDGKILHGGKNYPLVGARATVDTAGAIDKRVTATRLIPHWPIRFRDAQEKGREGTVPPG